MLESHVLLLAGLVMGERALPLGTVGEDDRLATRPALAVLDEPLDLLHVNR